MIAICENAQREGHFLGNKDLNLPVQQNCGLDIHLDSTRSQLEPHLFRKALRVLVRVAGFAMEHRRGFERICAELIKL